MPLPIFPRRGVSLGSLAGSSSFLAEVGLLVLVGVDGGVSCVVCVCAAGGCVWRSLSGAH